MENQENLEKKTVKDWIKYIQDEIDKSKNYDEYRHAFMEYCDYLEKYFLKNPKNVEVICQLAAVYNELTYQWEDIYKLLNEFIKKYENELTDEEKSRIYTNLGYYYDDQRDGSKRAIRTLRKAVAFNPNNSKAYYGLGANYYGAGKYDKSEEMYKRACELENNPIYKFEYANLLMVNGKNEEAKIILEELIKKDFEFGKEDFAKIKYSYIVNRIRLKEFENIESEINELMLETVNNDDFFEEEFAELYYLVGSYEKSRKIYSKFKIQDYQFPAWWLRFYFYSLKQLNEIEKLQENFKIVLKIKDEEIESIKNGEFLTECTESYKKEEIRGIKRQIKNLKAEYEKILKTDYKPEVKIYPKFLYDCFLIDCPRHQKLDK
ncbi:tetratricopeptide repeat protein [Leptotrichia sp. HSP-334]|uniref:Tetratricopeptide repeat protein n=1 Tax=Leptotrichia rugosa TaxID=3239302 RepID=A0AB39VIZ4_9FUSO